MVSKRYRSGKAYGFFLSLFFYEMEFPFLVSKIDIGISAWENRMIGKAGIFLRQFEEHLGVNVIVFFFFSPTRN